MSIFRNFSFLLLIAIAESSRFSDWGSDDRRIPGFIKSTVDWPPNPDFNSHITKSDFSPMSPWKLFLGHWTILNVENDPHGPQLEWNCALDDYIRNILGKICTDP